MSCCRFDRHRDRVFHEAGDGSCKDGRLLITGVHRAELDANITVELPGTGAARAARPAVFWSKLAVNILRIIFRLARRATDFFFALDNFRDGGSQHTIGVISVRVWAIAACITFGFAGTASAKPLDSPGTVYMDGLPCNVACQSYMAWSRQTLRAAKGTVTGGSYGTAREVPRQRLSKRSTPKSVDASPQMKNSADLQAALATAPEPAPLPKPRSENTPNSVKIREPAMERTPKENIIAALAVAEIITGAETAKSTDNDGTEGAGAAPANSANAAYPKNSGSALVVLLISRSDVKSASALNGLSIAIDVAQSGVEEDLRSSLVAAGAVETQLSVSDASPLDRLVSGEVPAAVLNLVSPAAADAFPEIKGFKVLRVPLSAR